MAKYDSLETYLRNVRGKSVRLTFDEINGILPSPLPRSAYEHSPFWSNTTVGSTHVWADAWQRAGWRVTGHSLENQNVDFRRSKEAQAAAGNDNLGEEVETDAEDPKEETHAGDNRDGRQEGEEVQLVAIRTRRGQPDFRDRLLRAYNGTCAVSGSTVVPLLEAAHIVPHAVETNYATGNGILLRADIHTLFDLHLMAVGADCRVAISRSLEWTEYAQYRGRRLVVLPADQEEQPSLDSLKLHHDLFVAREEALEG